MIHQQQLRDLVIEPVLRRMDMYSKSAVILLQMTAAHESGGGYYLSQVGGGPGAGLYQVEPATAADIVTRYLKRRVDLEDRFRSTWQILGSSSIDWDNLDLGKLRLKLLTDLRFGTALARLKYWMAPEPLPAADDLVGLAEYHKKHYNTAAGAADPRRTLADYRRVVLGEPID